MEALYKCLRCKSPITLDELRKLELGEQRFSKFREMKARCPGCGFRILFKPRHPIVKVVKAI